MPKLRTNRGAAKRFAKTGSGRFKRRQSFKRHILTKKSPKRKRQLRGSTMVVASDQREVQQLLPNS